MGMRGKAQQGVDDEASVVRGGAAAADISR